MKRFIGVAAGWPARCCYRNKLSAGNGATGVGVAPGITAASLNGRSDTTGDWSASDLDLRSNGEGSYGAFCRLCARQGSRYAA